MYEGEDLDKVQCVLLAINRAVGLPDGVALSVVLHRINKVQEADKQLQQWLAKRGKVGAA